MNWFIFASLAAVSFTIMSLIIRKAQILGVGSVLIYVYVVLLGGILALIFLLSKGEPIKVNKLTLVLLIIAAIFSMLGNIWAFKSYETSPNQGYSLAVTNTYAVLVTIFAVFLFKADFNLIKFTGVVLVVAGIILIGLKS